MDTRVEEGKQERLTQVFGFISEVGSRTLTQKQKTKGDQMFRLVTSEVPVKHRSRNDGQAAGLQASYLVWDASLGDTSKGGSTTTEED